MRNKQKKMFLIDFNGIKKLSDAEHYRHMQNISLLVKYNGDVVKYCTTNEIGVTEKKIKRPIGRK